MFPNIPTDQVIIERQKFNNSCHLWDMAFLGKNQNNEKNAIDT